MLRNKNATMPIRHCDEMYRTIFSSCQYQSNKTTLGDYPQLEIKGILSNIANSTKFVKSS